MDKTAKDSVFYDKDLSPEANKVPNLLLGFYQQKEKSIKEEIAYRFTDKDAAWSFPVYLKNFEPKGGIKRLTGLDASIVRGWNELVNKEYLKKDTIDPLINDRYYATEKFLESIHKEMAPKTLYKLAGIFEMRSKNPSPLVFHEMQDLVSEHGFTVHAERRGSKHMKGVISAQDNGLVDVTIGNAAARYPLQQSSEFNDTVTRSDNFTYFNPLVLAKRLEALGDNFEKVKSRQKEQNPEY